jgi:hypothetical protein
MPRLIKQPKFNEVSSVDKGAGRGTKVMFMKRDEAPKMQSLDQMIDGYCEIHKVDRVRATERVLTTPEGNRQYCLERDARLIKAAVGIGQVAKQGDEECGPGGKPMAGRDKKDMSPAATLEQLTRQHMKDHPQVGSKSRAYAEVLKTPLGRQLMQREREMRGLA